MSRVRKTPTPFIVQSWSIYRCLLGEGEHLAKLLEQDQAGSAKLPVACFYK